MVNRNLLVAFALLASSACSSDDDVTPTCTSNPAACITGTGVAADPYTATPPLADCLAYYPYATSDGVYTTHPVSADIDVYCDMTAGGVTYEDFGMGRHTASYAGWTLVGGADFEGSAQFDEAFSYLYNRNLGLTNLEVGFTSNNCCIQYPATSNWYGLAGSAYMYPAVSGATTYSCNPTGGYTAAKYQLNVRGGSVPTPVVKTTFTPGEAGTVAYYASCTTNANPGIFVKRYQ